MERVFLQIFLQCDLETVARSSWETIETHELASINLTRLLRLWSEVKQIKDPLLPTLDITTFDGKHALLISFFIDSVPTEDHLRSLLPNKEDSNFQLLYAVGPTAFAYCKMHKPNLPRCHEDDILQRLLFFHKQLRSQLEVRHPKAAHAIQVVASASRETTRPLSKKAARKQKQQRKAQNQAIPTTPNSGGKKKKQTIRRTARKKVARRNDIYVTKYIIHYGNEKSQCFFLIFLHS